MRFVAATLVAAAVFVGSAVAQQRPDFSGIWVLESSAGEMPGRTGGLPNVCGTARQSLSPAGAPRGTPGAAPEVMLQQSEASLTVEHRFGTVSRRHIYTFDGETVNRHDGAEFIRRSHWQGSTLVSEGSIRVLDPTVGVFCALTETMELTSDGALVLQMVRESPGGLVVHSRQSYTRKRYAYLPLASARATPVVTTSVTRDSGLAPSRSILSAQR